MSRSSRLGVIAAIFASFTWSLNFVAPFLIGGYSLCDLATARFLMSGMIGAAILCIRRDLCLDLTLRDWIVAAWLGFIGYVGYFLTVMIAAVYAGPVIPPAFLGLVPIILAITGNFYGSGISWTVLRVPLTLAAAGLVLVNVGSFLRLGSGDWNFALGLGICCAVGAVVLWTWFGIANQGALIKRPRINALVWSAMMMIGGSLQTLIFLPIGYHLKLFNAPTIGFGSTAVFHLYFPAFTLAAIASIGGSWAWTIASQRLPMALASQLLTTEMVFATCFGLLVHRRWPAPAEAIGIILLIIGVIKAIGAFQEMFKIAVVVERR